MGVATGGPPTNLICDPVEPLPIGPGRLRIIANGIPSAWCDVSVKAHANKPDHHAFGQLVIALLGGGEGGMVLLTPHGLKRIPPDDPLRAQVQLLRNRIVMDLHQLAELGRDQRD